MNASACPMRRQQDVAAGLVGLGLDREPHVVALVHDVLREQVHGLLVAIEGRADVLGRTRLGALAAAPADVRLGAEFGGQVEVAHHLADREAAYVAVVGRERTLLEDRVGEQVRGRGRDGEAGVGEALLEAGDDRVALGLADAEGDHVVVVEVDAVGAQAGEALQRVDGIHVRTRRVAERVTARPGNGPQTEGELVLGDGGVTHQIHPSLSMLRLRWCRSAPGRGAVAELRVGLAHVWGGVGFEEPRARGRPGGRLGCPASAQAAWRAAPRATYSSGGGRWIACPRIAGARACTAGLLVAPPTSRMRAGWRFIWWTRASTTSASEQKSASNAARARSARVVWSDKPVHVPVAVGPVGGALAAVVRRQGHPVGAARRGEGELGELVEAHAEQSRLEVEDLGGVDRDREGQEAADGVREAGHQTGRIDDRLVGDRGGDTGGADRDHDVAGLEIEPERGRHVVAGATRDWLADRRLPGNRARLDDGG